MTAETDYERWWNAGLTWAHYLRDKVRRNEALWSGVHARAAVPAWAVETAARIGGPWKLLVISEDWCGDASNTVPVLARMAEALPGIEMRIVARDEHPELMDRFLTRGSRSIPVAVVLRGDFSLAGWWGPRSAELQAWVLAEKAAGARPVEEIYRDVRRWYARDRGESIIREVFAVMADAA
jgi:hypothetical protein